VAVNRDRPDFRRVFHGQDEPVFRVLPERISENFKSGASENALLWNTFYPRRSSLGLHALLELLPLWGTQVPPEHDPLVPYFWGWSVEGQRLDHLDAVLQRIDGPGQKTEVDLFLVGGGNLIAIEAKNRAGLGRCSRYFANRCPEIHPDAASETRCIYWEPGAATFSSLLDFGTRPFPGSEQPPCAEYYQLSRTLLVVSELAAVMRLRPLLWMVVAESHWSGLKRRWVEFTDRMEDGDAWRGARVLSWRSIQQLPAS